MCVCADRYHEIDRDGSGTINIEEFMNSDSFKSSQMFYMSKSVFKSLDKDGSGDIEIDELLPIVFPLVRGRAAHRGGGLVMWARARP